MLAAPLPPSPNSTLRVAPRFNMSHNLLYGPLPPAIAAISAADMSYNYFDAAVGRPTPAAKVEFNCMSSAANQRSMAICTAFYSRHGLAFEGTAADVSSDRQLTPTPPKKQAASGAAEISQRQRKQQKQAGPLDGVFVGVLSALAAIVAAVVILLLVANCLQSHKRRCSSDGDLKKQDEEELLSELLRFVGRELSLAEVKKAMGGFDRNSRCCLWRRDGGRSSGYGEEEEIYQGVLEGVSVVVKRVDVRRRQSLRRLQREMKILLKHPHRRLVPLLGYCVDEQHHRFMLVYKHMANGDLRSLLQLLRRSGGGGGGGGADSSPPPLDWITRLKIATGAAEGLLHLHHGCSPAVVHSNIRASSILLDERFEARLGSLGGAMDVEQGGAAVERPPPPPPRHGAVARRMLDFVCRSGGDGGGAGRGDGKGPSCSYDVYCFGKLLLQLITGEEELVINGGGGSMAALPCLISDSLHKDNKRKLVDPSLILDDDLAKEVRGVAMVAKWCLHPKPSKRPSMRQVLKALQNPFMFLQNNGGGLLCRSNSSYVAAAPSRRQQGSWSDLVFGGFWHHSQSSSMVGSDCESTHRDEAPPARRRYGSREVFPEPYSEGTIES